MPVEKNIGTPPRQIVFLIISMILGIGSMVFVFTQINDQANTDLIQNELGASFFILGQADELAGEIDDKGPFLFSDVAGGDRDIFIQHVGDDPESGWLAFGVRPLAATRDCFVEWQPKDNQFMDNCDGVVYPDTGDGLPSYEINVSDGLVAVNLS